MDAANEDLAKPGEMLIGALLRVPAQAIHRRIIRELNAVGFDELRLPHMAVFSHPGPEGVRPGVLAERAGMSKQAMNQLLGSLEDCGYLARTDEGGARIIRLTPRGHEAFGTVIAVVRQVETEWQAELGARRFAQLKALLQQVMESPLIR